MANKKYLDLSFLLISFLLWFATKLALSFFWDQFSLPVLVDWPIGYPDIIALFFALFFYVGLKKHKQANEFGLEVLMELNKVVWPTQKETFVSTGVVLVMLVIAALSLMLMDFAWGALTRSFLEF